MSRIAPDAALAEAALRELARRRLVRYGEYVYPWWKPAAVHELVCNELEAVYTFIESGGTDGVGALILEMPPQHGKTTMVSRLFASWLLGKRPDSNVILTSYNDDLAGDNSREVRMIVTGERFAAVFGTQSAVEEPVMISDDSTARNAWRLAEPHRGGVRAAGVGGGTTGRPADLIVIDDPFKNREEAENPTLRKKVLKWYTSSILTRRKKGTAIVIIHTRWHREDLIGEVIKTMVTSPKTLHYKIVSLPAEPLEAEEYAKNETEQRGSMMAGLYRPLTDPLGRAPGSRIPLWNDEFPREMLEQIRNTLEASGQLGDWYALYQQQPRPSEGAFFGVADFEIVERAPRGLQWFRYVDLAISEKKTADFNASVACGIDRDGITYFRDMIRGQGWIEFRAILSETMLSREEKGVMWGIEDVGFQALAVQELLQDRRLQNVAILPIKPEGDKVTRARPLQARGKARKVRLVRGSWNSAFLMEMLDFPTGVHDDQVDAASGSYGMAAEYTAYGTPLVDTVELEEVEA